MDMHAFDGVRMAHDNHGQVKAKEELRRRPPGLDNLLAIV
jgi:hypothetical protein